MLSFEPLEVVDLIPLVGGGIYTFTQLKGVTLAHLLRHFRFAPPASITYVACGDRREPDSGAVLNDRPAAAVQVEIDVVALVDADLPSRDHDDAVGDARDVRRAVHVAGDDEALGDALDGEARKGRLPGRRDGHVDDAAREAGQAAGGGGPRRGGGQDDVQAGVVRDVDVARRREAGLADARAARLGHLGVVILAGEGRQGAHGVPLLRLDGRGCLRVRCWLWAGQPRGDAADARQGHELIVASLGDASDVCGSRLELEFGLWCKLGSLFVELIGQCFHRLALLSVILRSPRGLICEKCKYT